MGEYSALFAHRLIVCGLAVKVSKLAFFCFVPFHVCNKVFTSFLKVMISWLISLKSMSGDIYYWTANISNRERGGRARYSTSSLKKKKKKVSDLMHAFSRVFSWWTFLFT